MTSRKAVFLDKDGTLVRDVPFNVDPGKIRLESGAIEALRLLHTKGYMLVVVSNQSGVARGMFPEKVLVGVRKKLNELFSRSSVPLTDFYYCPHHPEGVTPGYRTNCFCRKPQPGMLMRAAVEHRIDLANSWMVGDILDDVEAGKAAGCRTILIDNGNETEWVVSERRKPDFYAPSLAQAARIIVTLSSYGDKRPSSMRRLGGQR